MQATLTQTLPFPKGAARLAERPLRLYLQLAGLHVALAFALKFLPILSTLHAYAVLAIGVRLAAVSRYPHRAVYVAAYIAGAELIWRITKANVFWEQGKYAIILILGILMLRHGFKRGRPILGLIYFILLVPSCILTIQASGLLGARGPLSFNLSGPLCLAVSVMFFSGFPTSKLRLDRLLQAMIWPIITLLTLAGYGTLTAEEIRFGLNSNYATSGGYGPNQVSALLGLGCVLSLLLVLHAKNLVTRLFFGALSGLFLTQAFLTFSRGGIFNAMICLVLIGMHHIQDRRMRRIFLVALVVALPIGLKLIWPTLDQLTEGTLALRYSSLDTTGRKEIAYSDFQMWMDHFTFGVGPGLSAESRPTYGLRKFAAHTEFSRLVAEHGMLGATAFLMLLVMIFLAYRAAPTVIARAWVAGLSGWVFAEMSHAAMRISVISFLFGLAVIYWPRQAAYRPQQKVRYPNTRHGRAPT